MRLTKQEIKHLRVPQELEEVYVQILEDLYGDLLLDPPVQYKTSENFFFKKRRGTSEQFSELQRLKLVTAEGGSLRPTVLGALHILRAWDGPKDATDFDKLVELAQFGARSYRPEARDTIQAPQLMDVLGIQSDKALRRILAFWNDIDHGSAEYREGTAGQPFFVPSSAVNHASGRLPEMIRRAYPDRYERSAASLRRFDWAETPFLTCQLKGVFAKNFRALRSIDLDLGDVTVLVGPNGVGKSTILDIPALISRIARFGLRVGLGSEELRFWRTRGSGGPVEMGIRFTINHGDGPVSCSYGIALDELHGATIVARERLSLLEEGKERVLLDTLQGRSTLELPDGTKKTLYGSAGTLALYDLATERDFPFLNRIRNALARIALIDIDPVIAEGQVELETVFNMPSPLMYRAGVQLMELLDPFRAPGADLAKLAAAIRELVPTIKSIERVLEVEKPVLSYYEDGVDGPLYFEDLSAGTRQMLLIAAAWLQPQARPALLLEEPDARVHPAALPALVSLLRDIARKTPVVVTTHSPAFIGHLDASAEVLALERRDGMVNVSPLHALVKSHGWLREFGSNKEAFDRIARERLPKARSK